MPLLKHLKFLCIATSNLDEFFQIRFAGLKQKLESGGQVARGPDMSPQEALAAIG